MSSSSSLSSDEEPSTGTLSERKSCLIVKRPPFLKRARTLPYELRLLRQMQIDRRKRLAKLNNDGLRDHINVIERELSQLGSIIDEDTVMQLYLEHEDELLFDVEDDDDAGPSNVANPETSDQQDQPLESDVEDDVEDYVEEDVEDYVEEDVEDYVEEGAEGYVADYVEEDVEDYVENDVEVGVENDVEVGIENNVEVVIENNVEVGIENNVEIGFDDNVEVGIENNVEIGFDDNVEVGIENNVEVGIENNVEIGFDDNVEIGVEDDVEVGIENDVEVGIENDVEVGAENDVEVGVDDDVEVGVDDNVEIGFDDNVEIGFDDNVEIGVEDDVEIGVEDDVEVGVDDNVEIGVENDVEDGVEDDVEYSVEDDVEVGVEIGIENDESMESSEDEPEPSAAVPVIDPSLPSTSAGPLNLGVGINDEDMLDDTDDEEDGDSITEEINAARDFIRNILRKKPAYKRCQEMSEAWNRRVTRIKYSLNYTKYIQQPKTSARRIKHFRQLLHFVKEVNEMVHKPHVKRTEEHYAQLEARIAITKLMEFTNDHHFNYLDGRSILVLRKAEKQLANFHYELYKTAINSSV